MDVGNLSQLEDPLESDREIILPAQKKEIFGLMIFLRDFFDEFAFSQDTFDLPWDCFLRSDDLLPTGQGEDPHSSREQRQQGQEGDLGSKSLRGGDPDFRTGMRVNATPGLTGNGAADDVADSQNRVAPALGFAQAGERIGDLARLGDGHHQSVFFNGRISAVTGKVALRPARELLPKLRARAELLEEARRTEVVVIIHAVVFGILQRPLPVPDEKEEASGRIALVCSIPI